MYRIRSCFCKETVIIKLYSRITGTGSYFPEQVLTNKDLEKVVDTSDEWITTRTGIKQRHVSRKDETNTDMALKASLNALDMAGIAAGDLDGIIFPTVSPDYAFPASAAILQHKLGIAGQFCFDTNTACAGFIYSLNMADALIKTGKYKNILIASSEKLTAMTDYKDRSTCILFGDGAGAVVVSASDTPGILSCNMYGDGSYEELLHMKGMGSVMLSSRDVMSIEDNLIKMQGSEVFKVAVRMMIEASENAIEQSGLKAEDIDFLVPHQANMRIIEAVVKRFAIDTDRALINIDRRGNTSSATIPTVLDENVRSGRVKKGDNLLMCAFGGGFNWGAAVVTL